MENDIEIAHHSEQNAPNLVNNSLKIISWPIERREKKIPIGNFIRLVY